MSEKQKTDRIEARVDPDRGNRIRHAAELSQKSVSAFVMDAAAEYADRVITSQSETVVSAAFFDALLAALDDEATDRDIPALREAGARARKIVKPR